MGRTVDGETSLVLRVRPSPRVHREGAAREREGTAGGSWGRGGRPALPGGGRARLESGGGGRSTNPQMSKTIRILTSVAIPTAFAKEIHELFGGNRGRSFSIVGPFAQSQGVSHAFSVPAPWPSDLVGHQGGVEQAKQRFPAW